MSAAAQLPNDLIERNDVFRDALTTLRATTTSGSATSIVLVGPGGVGTSRLARALAETAATSGAIVFDWTAHQGTDSVPTGDLAVIDGLHRLDQHAGAEVAAWLRADPTHRLVATARPGRPLPERVAGLWSSGRIARFDVKPLTVMGIESLAGRILGGPVTRGLVHGLSVATEGLPLLVREALADAVADDTVTRRDGIWVWRGDGSTVGQRVQDLSRARIAGLDLADRHVIDVVAESNGAPARILERVVDADGLDRCERLGYLHADERGFLEVRPPIVAQALRQSLSRSRRSTLRRALADAFDRDPNPPEDLVLLATTWSLDEGLTPGPELAVAAAAAANRRGDLRVARRLAAAAFGSSSDGAARLAAAHALRLSGLAAEALLVLDDRPADRTSANTDGVGEVNEVDDGDELDEQFAIARADVYQFGLDDADRGHKLLEQRWATTRSRRIHVQRLVNLLYAGRYAESVPVLDAYAKDPDTPALDMARMAGPLAVAQAFSGRSAAAQRLLDQGGVAARSEGRELPFAAGDISNFSFLIHVLFGIHPIRTTDLTTSFVGPVHTQSLVQLGISLTTQNAGDAARTLVEVEKAIAALSVRDPAGCLAAALAIGARAAVEAGRLGRAAELVKRLDQTPRFASGLVEPEIRRNLLWPAFAAGGAVRVSSEGYALVADCRRQGLYGIELLTRHSMMRLGVVGVAPDRELIAANDSPVAHVFGMQFAALTARDAEGMLRASAELEDMGYPILAAEAAAQAHHMAREHGSPARTRVAGQRVRALTRELDTAPYPLLQDWSSFQQLTNREREVVALARQHLTNGEIAERLGRSRRTIEGHLHRAYTKLGVNDRAYLE